MKTADWKVVVDADSLTYEAWATDYERVWSLAEQVGAVVWVHDEWTDGPEPHMDPEKAVLWMGGRKDGFAVPLAEQCHVLNMVAVHRGWSSRPRQWRTRCECEQCRRSHRATPRGVGTS